MITSKIENEKVKIGEKLELHSMFPHNGGIGAMVTTKSGNRIVLDVNNIKFEEGNKL